MRIMFKKKNKTVRKKSFFRKMLDPTDHENSSKRFVTLIVSFHFIIASFFMLFLIWAIVFRETRTNIELFKSAGDILKEILLYDFGIIAIGLGFITAEQFTKMFIEKYKALTPNSPWGGHNNDYDPTCDPKKQEEMPIEELSEN